MTLCPGISAFLIEETMKEPGSELLPGSFMLNLNVFLAFFALPVSGI